VGDDCRAQRFGDFLSKEERYARADEFLTVVRGAWSEDGIDFDGDHYTIRGARVEEPPAWPPIYFGGSSEPALRVAARHADVYLTWGEPPIQVSEKLARIRALAEAEGRLGAVRFGIRLHVIARATAAEAWAAADQLIANLDEAQFASAQAIQRHSESEGQRRMRELHGGRLPRRRGRRAAAARAGVAAPRRRARAGRGRLKRDGIPAGRAQLSGWRGSSA